MKIRWVSRGFYAALLFPGLDTGFLPPPASRGGPPLPSEIRISTGLDFH